MVSALALVPLSYAVLCGVEIAGITQSKASLQAAVDGGALAGAGELNVATRGDDGIRSTAIAPLAPSVSQHARSFSRCFPVWLQASPQLK